MGRLFIIRFFGKESVKVVKGGDWEREKELCK